MARRKRGFIEDDISDSGGSDDDENTDDDPYQRKKRRTTADDDSEDEGFGGRPKPTQRHDWAKAPAFVSGKKVDQFEVMDIPDVDIPDVETHSDSEESESDGTKDEDGEEDVDEDDADDTDNNVNEPSKAPSPRVRDERDDEEELRPRFGGLGLGASKLHPPTSFSGFTKSGIGASRPAAVSIPATPSPAPSPSPAPAPPPPAFEEPTIHGNLPSAFGGGSSRPQRAFVRHATPQAPPPPKPSLSASESAHFRKLESSFGARMLAKMGWQTGTGLGAESQGIVAPIETKVRPKNMGIAFKGFTERTEQSRAEARRRGEVLSDDEEEGVKKKAPKNRKADNTSDAWKKPKKVKTKVQHKTYEQIVAEVGEDTGASSGLGVIIDATGATVCLSFALD